MLARHNGYFAEYVWVPENRVYTRSDARRKYLGFNLETIYGSWSPMQKERATH
jgi:hypothetical protein